MSDLNPSDIATWASGNVDRIVFTLPGRPQTKKTSQFITPPRKSDGRQFVVASKETKAWTKQVEPFMRRAMRGRPLLTGPVRVGYRFFLAPAQRADLGGLEAALDDAMEGIVYGNDRQIEGRDWSEKSLDATPRVEVMVRAIMPQQIDLPEGGF